MNGSCPDGPGHGAASGPGYCRGPVAKRRGTMGRYLRAMAGPDSPQAPAGGGAGYWPLPCPARTWKPRRWSAIRGPRHMPSAPREPACQGCGLFWPLPWPAGEVKPRRWAAIRGPRPGLSAPMGPAGQGAGYSARALAQRWTRARDPARPSQVTTRPAIAPEPRAEMDFAHRRDPASDARLTRRWCGAVYKNRLPQQNSSRMNSRGQTMLPYALPVTWPQPAMPRPRQPPRCGPSNLQAARRSLAGA